MVACLSDDEKPGIQAIENLAPDLPPTHDSWLNPIETPLGRMARTVLRGIRVKSKAELRECILK